ncbi:MAG: SAM-dependent methyltransferase [Alphaproteobacteria bacterium]|nr:SAM-dependent methyltransferase [Alphaproteobacteria bacterium]
MSRLSRTHKPEVIAYLRRFGVREPAHLRRLRADTARLPEAGMQISPEQGALLAMLVRAIGARRAIEVGTFTGYSSTAIAEAMGPDGRLVCCDVSESWTRLALKTWKRAGVAGRITLRLAPALDSLDELIAQGLAGRFDFAFVDADKENYLGYFERCLTLLRRGGMIAVDNTLWGGSVIDPKKQDSATRAIRRFNRAVSRDRRIDLSMVPIGDGLTLARKRAD